MWRLLHDSASSGHNGTPAVPSGSAGVSGVARHAPVGDGHKLSEAAIFSRCPSLDTGMAGPDIADEIDNFIGRNRAHDTEFERHLRTKSRDSGSTSLTCLTWALAARTRRRRENCAAD
jgi:hypothetical protein